MRDLALVDNNLIYKKLSKTHIKILQTCLMIQNLRAY